MTTPKSSKSPLHALLEKEMSRKDFLKFCGALVAAGVGITGILSELLSYASTPSTSVEGESGTATSPTAVTTDTSASGGKAVKFGTRNGNLKMIYGGLFTSQEANRVSYSPPLDHIWIKLNWSDLEPSQGVYNWAPIDSLISTSSTSPGTYTKLNVKVRLHIQGGDNAPVGTQTNPGWLANLTGGGVMVTNTRAGTSGYCGRYWEQAYKDAYAAFVTALGNRYDSNPLLASINMFGCSLIFDEPWIIGGDSTSAINLYQSGMTQTTQAQAIMDGVAATAKAFPTTVFELPTHSEFTWPTSTGIGSSWPFGRDMLNTLHGMYGQHIVITDYGLGPNEAEAPQPLLTATTQYSWMHQRAVEGYPIAFQATLAPAGTSDTSTLQTGGCDAAIAMQARWYEHHDWALLTNTQVQTYDAEFKANVV